MGLSREEILGAALARTTIPAPEWRPGGTVDVVSLDMARREAVDVYLYETEKKGEKRSLFAALAAASITNGDGSPAFTVEDTPMLEVLPAAPIMRIWEFHREHSGYAKLEDLVKNSETGPRAATNSGSPSA